MDPTQTSNATDLMTVAWNFEGLVFPANDGTAIEGALAESWDVSEDGLTYTFHLRDGLKFYNGDAVTAEDILYSLNRAIDPEKSIFAGFLTAIAGIECPGRHDGRCDAEGPDAGLPVQFHNALLRHRPEGQRRERRL